MPHTLLDQSLFSSRVCCSSWTHSSFEMTRRSTEAKHVLVALKLIAFGNDRQPKARVSWIRLQHRCVGCSAFSMLSDCCIAPATTVLNGRVFLVRFIISNNDIAFASCSPARHQRLSSYCSVRDEEDAIVTACAHGLCERVVKSSECCTTDDLGLSIRH